MNTQSQYQHVTDGWTDAWTMATEHRIALANKKA